METLSVTWLAQTSSHYAPSKGKLVMELIRPESSSATKSSVASFHQKKFSRKGMVWFANHKFLDICLEKDIRKAANSHILKNMWSKL